MQLRKQYYKMAESVRNGATGGNGSELVTRLLAGMPGSVLVRQSSGYTHEQQGDPGVGAPAHQKPKQPWHSAHLVWWKYASNKWPLMMSHYQVVPLQELTNFAEDLKLVV